MMKHVTVAPAGKVLIIVENLPVPFDRRVWQEAKALTEAGYLVSVICPKGRGYERAEETIDGIHIYRHDLPLEARGVWGYLIEYSYALVMELFLSFRVLRRHGFDVIHACNPPDLIFLVALVHKLLFGKRFVYDQHDLVPELFEVKFKRRGPVQWLVRLLERCSFRLADVCLATSDTLKELAMERGRKSRDEVWVVRSFPDLQRFVRRPVDPGAKRDHAFLVGYVGIMGEQDGVELLVRAAHHLVLERGRTDIGFVIIGDGPERNRLIALTSELGLEKNVRFAGYLTGDALLSELSACDIGVIPDPPNVCNDKLSMNKVFEYMALGLPFVQFDLKQARRDAGDAALVVEEVSPVALGGGIQDLLADPDRRAYISSYATARARREFDWNGEQARLLAAYSTLLPGPVVAGMTSKQALDR
jgi:glycosyltransferase involved in cell wall biosynthesis